MTIDSPEGAETLVACFQNGSVEDVARVRTESPGRLLDEPDRRPAITFLETLRPSSPTLISRMLQLRSALRSGRLDLLESDSLFTALATELLAAEQKVVERAQEVPAVKAATRLELLRRVSRARDFIEAELAGDLTLERIARAACLSPYHCHRMFSAVFRETPHAYVTRRRLERARTLLATTESSVTDVCLRVGFSSIGSFGSRFRDAFGVSPGALRRRGRLTARQGGEGGSAG
jgi:AraC family transcriptional regulator